MPSHFLAVRFPLGVLWEDDVSSDTVSLDTYPPGAYEEQPHVFYETDSESVATELVRLFRSIEPPSGLGLEPLAESPPIYDVVSTAGLDLAQCVLLREDLRKHLDRIEQVVSMSKDDWDPAGLAEKGLPHDRRTYILMLFNDQARQWEPLVRDELGVDNSDRDAETATGDKPGTDGGAGPGDGPVVAGKTVGLGPGTRAQALYAVRDPSLRPRQAQWLLETIDRVLEFVHVHLKQFLSDGGCSELETLGTNMNQLAITLDLTTPDMPVYYSYRAEPMFGCLGTIGNPTWPGYFPSKGKKSGFFVDPSKEWLTRIHTLRDKAKAIVTPAAGPGSSRDAASQPGEGEGPQEETGSGSVDPGTAGRERARPDKGFLRTVAAEVHTLLFPPAPPENLARAREQFHAACELQDRREQVRKEWRRKGAEHVDKARESARLRDKDAGPPEERWEWIDTGHLVSKYGVAPSGVEEGAWVPPELVGPKLPPSPMPGGESAQDTPEAALARQYFVLAVVHDNEDRAERRHRRQLLQGINLPRPWVPATNLGRDAMLHGGLEGFDRKSVERALGAVRADLDRLGHVLSGDGVHSASAMPGKRETRPSEARRISGDVPTQLAKLEEETPPLNKKSGEWVLNKDAAFLESVQTGTLKDYRSDGIRTPDKMLGQDTDGRVWRRSGTTGSHPWYLKATLKSQRATRDRTSRGK